MLFNVQDLPGIKPRQVKILQEQGIMTAQALAMLAPDALAEVEGMSANSAKQLIWQARQSLNLTAFTPAADIHEDYRHITTLSSELNRILGGGVSTGRITEDCSFFITEAGISDSEEVTYGGPVEGETPAAASAAGSPSAEEPPKKGGKKKAPKRVPEPEVPEVGDEV